MTCARDSGYNQRLGARGAALRNNAHGPVLGGAGHRIGQSNASQGLEGRDLLGNGIKRVSEHVIRAAYLPAPIFQAVHGAQVRDRVDPVDTNGVIRGDALTRTQSLARFAEHSIQHRHSLAEIRTEVNRQHLAHEHLEGRQRSAGRAIDLLPQCGKELPDLVGSADTASQGTLVEHGSSEFSQPVRHPLQFLPNHLYLGTRGDNASRQSALRLPRLRGPSPRHFPPFDRVTFMFQSLGDGGKIIAHRAGAANEGVWDWEMHIGFERRKHGTHGTEGGVDTRHWLVGGDRPCTP